MRIFRRIFRQMAHGRKRTIGRLLHSPAGSAARRFGRERQDLLRPYRHRKARTEREGGYPKVFNVESNPREEHNMAEMYEWVIGPILRAVEDYKKNLEKYLNPAAANLMEQHGLQSLGQ
jgi:hypothetical protein